MAHLLLPSEAMFGCRNGESPVLRATRRGRAFTLVELMIVVAIIGMLASISVPYYVRCRENSQNGRFASDLRVTTGAFIQYSQEHGGYPPDTMPGVVPTGMVDYLKGCDWTNKTAIGGQWDWDYRQFGFTAGVSVYQPPGGDSQLRMIDKLIDDGDLSGGSFRYRTAGYISIIEN